MKVAICVIPQKKGICLIVKAAASKPKRNSICASLKSPNSNFSVGGAEGELSKRGMYVTRSP
jgi:hypothetical protein